MSRGLLVTLLSVNVVACAVSLARGQVAPNALKARAVLTDNVVEIRPADTRKEDVAVDDSHAMRSSSAGTGHLKDRFHCDFRGANFDEARLRLEGNSTKPIPEPEGLRIKLPAGPRTGKQPGVRSRFVIGGDFEITASYEILSADQPETRRKNVGAWLRIETVRIPAMLPEAGYEKATIRGVLGDQNEYLFVTNHMKATTGIPSDAVQRTTGQGRQAKLRLVRAGSMLQFFVAEGDEGKFREIRRVDFSRDDIQYVALTAESTDAKVAAEVRWLDLDVRAEYLPGIGTKIVTIENQRIDAEIKDTQDGRLLLANADERSPAEMPIDDLYHVEFKAPSPLEAKFFRHQRRDVAQGSPKSGGDGFSDVHFVVEGLRADQKLKQLTLVLQKSKDSKTWRLDTSFRDDWKLAVERLPGATWADVYFQPDAQDRYGHEYGVSVTYEDQVKSATRGRLAFLHTHGDMRVDDETADLASPRWGVLAYLTGGDRLFGHFDTLDERSLVIDCGWDNKVAIPLIHVKGVRCAREAESTADAQFEQLLKEPPEEDTVLVIASDGSATQIAGQIEQVTDGKLDINYEGQLRSIRTERLFGWVFAQRPAVERGASPYQVFEFVRGDALAGEFLGFDHDRPELKTAWDAVLRVPRKALAGIGFHNGKMVYLSDLDPVEVEEVPYFDRLLPHKRDMALDGGPLTIDGTTYEKGLAVHSRCVLTYALDGQFATFSAVLGFDTRATRAGRVTCRVVGDGRDLFVVEDFTANDPPQALELPIDGVRRLSLEVDFGADEDIGDRIIWARARVMRASTD